jgi:CxxC motif-containing protein
MKELICITCPKGCHLKVDVENGYAVTGNSCPRGAEYAVNELKNPKRVVTSTVRTDSELYPRCPVKTSGAIPKEKMFEAMALLDGIVLKAPVSIGQKVVENLFGTGIDFVATRNIK